MDEALAAIGHEVRLRLAPPTQRRRPLRGPPDVERRLAHLDHRAVDDPGDDRRHLTGGHRHHHLVELADAVGLPAAKHERLPATQAGERGDVRILEPLAEPRRGAGFVDRDSDITTEQLVQRLGDQEQTALRTVGAGVLEEPAGAGEPSAGRCLLAAQEQREREPQRVAGGAAERHRRGDRSWWARVQAASLSVSAPTR